MSLSYTVSCACTMLHSQQVWILLVFVVHTHQQSQLNFSHHMMHLPSNSLMFGVMYHH